MTRTASAWSFVSPLLKAHRGWLPTPSGACSRRGPWRTHRRGRGWAWVTRVVGQSLKVCGPELPEPSLSAWPLPAPQLLVTPLSPGGSLEALSQCWAHGIPMGREGAGSSCGARVPTSRWQCALPWALAGHIFTGSLRDFKCRLCGAESVDEGRGGGLGSTWFFVGLRLVEELLGLCGQVCRCVEALARKWREVGGNLPSLHLEVGGVWT